MIKEEFPNVHITIGGNIVTRIRDELKTQDKLFEYMAACKPIIASNLPSIKEVVKDIYAKYLYTLYE